MSFSVRSVATPAAIIQLTSDGVFRGRVAASVKLAPCGAAKANPALANPEIIDGGDVQMGLWVGWAPARLEVIG